jgi:hypothetical protein
MHHIPHKCLQPSIIPQKTFNFRVTAGKTSNMFIFMAFEFFVVVTMKSTVFLNITPNNLKDIYWYFKEIYCLNFQNKQEKKLAA